MLFTYFLYSCTDSQSDNQNDSRTPEDTGYALPTGYINALFSSQKSPDSADDVSLAQYSNEDVVKVETLTDTFVLTEASTIYLRSIAIDGFQNDYPLRNLNIVDTFESPQTFQLGEMFCNESGQSYSLSFDEKADCAVKLEGVCKNNGGSYSEFRYCATHSTLSGVFYHPDGLHSDCDGKNIPEISVTPFIDSWGFLENIECGMEEDLANTILQSNVVNSLLIDVQHD